MGKGLCEYNERGKPLIYFNIHKCNVLAQKARFQTKQISPPHLFFLCMFPYDFQEFMIVYVRYLISM